MAENEILDVRNPNHYRRSRKALEDPSLLPEQVAESFSEDFLEVFLKKLSGLPLNLLLKACENDPIALQDVIAKFKYQQLMKMVEQAYRITNSSNIGVISNKVAEMLIDRLIDNANCFVAENGYTRQEREKLRNAMLVKLESMKNRIVASLTASLLGEPVTRAKRVKKVKIAPSELVNASLLIVVKKLDRGEYRV